MMDLTLPRRVAPELLDELAAGDPRAQRSRADLRRIHRAMATLSILEGALDRIPVASAPRSLLEIGAGDGSLMLRLATRRAARWPAVRATLLDRLNIVAPHTLERLRQVGWTPRVVAMDVFDWLAIPDGTRWDVIYASLFIHHFSSAELVRMLGALAARTRVFFCCEPRRSALALLGSHLVALLGAGPVTRHDAVSSVHAGFQGRELSALWPESRDWVVDEYKAGLFSHCFLAIRKER